MKLDFNGIITKEEIEKDVSNLDSILKDNEYAIVVEKGKGKYVVFDIDYVTDKLELKENVSKIKNYKKSPFTLVESMIQTLEELPEKKTTAIMLSSLVEKFYGRTVSPVTIRTRAEENANGQGEVNYFITEPGNVIGLERNSGFELYMNNKMKRAIEFELNKILRNESQVELNVVLHKANQVISHPNYKKYALKITNKDIKKMIISMGKYTITNNYVGLITI